MNRRSLARTSPRRTGVRIATLSLLALLAVTALSVHFSTTLAVQDHGGWSPPSAGKEHERLARFAGEWSSTARMFGQESRGSESNRILPGGLWVLSEVKGRMMGRPFEGISLYGYDPHKKKYVSVWVDSTSPSLSVSEGDYDAGTDSIVYFSAMSDPSTGQAMRMQIVERFLSKTERRMTMSMDGSEEPMMTIDYRRRTGD